MLYKELKSLSYGSIELYEKEYSMRINSEDCVKLNFYINKNQAFFLHNSEVWELALQIMKYNCEISSLCNKLPGIALNQYSRKCLIDEIVLTNKIEGVHSSRKEIGDALHILSAQSFKNKGSKNRFTGLVNKYYKLTSPEKIELLTCKNIRDIYDEVFLQEILYEDSGNAPDGVLFRKNSVTVYSDTAKEIHYGLMPEERIIEAVQQALDFLNDESIEALFRICIFHYLIEYIHPFYDGNGRLGRFILSYGISQNLYPLVAFKISETIKENIRRYYKAFKACNDPKNRGDLTPFLIMQLNMILISMEELKTSLDDRLSTWMQYKSITNTLFGSDENTEVLVNYMIQATLFSENGISMDELITNMNCSNYIIKKLMESLPGNLIYIKKNGHVKYYNIDLQILQQL